MPESIIRNLVEEDFGYKREGSNWGRSEKHSSLIVNESSEKWYWNSEHIGGTALDYLILIRHYTKDKAKELLGIREKFNIGQYIETPEKVYYNPFEKMVDIMWELGKGNRGYWYKRKLTDKTIDRYRLGFYDGWSMFPLYIGDTFVNFQCRRDEPEKKIRLWYTEEKWKPVLINAEILNIVDKVFITEGTVDALLLTQEGIPAVAQTSGAVYWSPFWYSSFNRIKSIYYITDNDEAGRIAAGRVSKALGQDRVKVYQFKDKAEKYDTVDFFRDGGNAKEFKELVEKDSKYLFEIGELNASRPKNKRSERRFLRTKGTQRPY